MKVLFVCSGNKKFEDSPIVSVQGDSLVKAGVDLEYFFILGRGIYGYLKSMFRLRRHLRKNQYDLVHAHYSLSGFISTLAGGRPLVVSLMGSDIHCRGGQWWLIRLFNKKRWEALIVKSEQMKQIIGIASVCIVPNGVDLARFQPMPQSEAKRRVGFDGRKHVIFVGNPVRPEKNVHLARKAMDLLADGSMAFDVVTQRPHQEIADILNAGDILLLTSVYEGSPNVIKEAMACNCPIVATAVGDVERVIGDTPGCFITSFDSNDVAAKIKMALDFNKRTSGRERIIKLGLDSDRVAKQILGIYKSVLKPAK